MRCVSYTRSISGSYEKINAAASIPDLRVLEPCKNITDQNLEIAEYMKQKRWTVSKKYSDRRQDGSEVSSFNRLIADGIDRNYDLVVTWSMFFFGEDVQAAVDLLLDIFYPAGIHPEQELLDHAAENNRLNWQEAADRMTRDLGITITVSATYQTDDGTVLASYECVGAAG